jgi:predicted Zn finger-like uncharacterized protein
MRIACPTCAAEYEVPAARLTPQKMVRCARCGGKWMAVQAAEAPAPVPDAPVPDAGHSVERPVASLPTVTAMDRLAAQAIAAPARPTRLIAAWVVTAVVLVAGVAGTLIWREAVVATWPASGRLLGPLERPTPATAAATAKAVDQSRPETEAHH